jgi:tetratricopeptide (TPR) repeat protein
MITILRYINILLLLSGIVYPSRVALAARPEPDETHRSEILHLILSLRFDEADSLLRPSHAKDPGISGTPGNLYLQNYLEFMEALISGERDAFDGYHESSGKRIKSIRDAVRENPGSYIDLSSIHLQSSLLCAYHGDNYRAIKHFYQAYRNLRHCEEKNPDHPGKLRNRGLINLIVGSVPDEYSWLLKVFGMRGEIREGFGYLEEYHAFSRGTERIEACLLIKFARQTLSQGTRDDGTDLICLNDPSTLEVYVNALSDLGAGKSLKVIECLGNYRQGEDERAFPYKDLLLGEALLNNLDTAAITPLERYLQNHSGKHYMHYAWHKLSWSYALNGEWNRYLEARQQVIDSGEPSLDADRQALSEALDTIPLNMWLLKGRLLFDGGQYNEALHCLENIPEACLRCERDSVEFLYRLARIHDRLGNSEFADEKYKRVIMNGEGTDWYFAPNAALHLGMLHESAGDIQKAMEYYRECLKINRSAYKRSIDYKARQGIRRIEKLLELH